MIYTSNYSFITNINCIVLINIYIFKFNKMNKQLTTTRNFCSPEMNETIRLSLSYLTLKHKEKSIDTPSFYKPKNHLTPLETSPNFEFTRDNIYSRLILNHPKKNDKRYIPTRTVKGVFYLKARNFPQILMQNTLSQSKGKRLRPLGLKIHLRKSEQHSQYKISKTEENTKESTFLKLSQQPTKSILHKRFEENDLEKPKVKISPKFDDTKILVKNYKTLKTIATPVEEDKKLIIRTNTHIKPRLSEDEFYNKIKNFEQRSKVHFIIDSYVTKTYTNLNGLSTSSHFSLNHLFNQKDFSIFGVCEGDYKSLSSVLSSMAKESFISHLSNNITYDIPYRFTTQDILRAVTQKDYDLIKTVFSCVCYELKNSCRLDTVEGKLSASIIFIIENEIICANIGKDNTFALKRSLVNKAEYLNSVKLSSSSDSTIPYISQFTFKDDIKYIVMGSSHLWEKNSPSNLFKVICINNINLEEKANTIYQYELKLAKSNNNYSVDNIGNINEDFSYSLIMIQF